LLNVNVSLISLADYEMPLYDGDLEKRDGVPQNANRLRKMMAAQDGIYIATPEYNASIPPLLKNAIDWVSRSKEPPANPFKQCTFALGATSNGRFGGYRSLYHLRQVLELGLGALVLPGQVAISQAESAFDESGALKDDGNRKLLAASLERLIAMSGARA
jgi:chromate reductase